MNIKTSFCNKQKTVLNIDNLVEDKAIRMVKPNQQLHRLIFSAAAIAQIPGGSSISVSKAFLVFNIPRSRLADIWVRHAPVPIVAALISRSKIVMTVSPCKIQIICRQHTSHVGNAAFFQ